MVTVYLWNLSKTCNSTLKPSVIGSEFLCEFIEPLNILTPTLKFHFNTRNQHTGNDILPDVVVPPYNYAQIQEFGNRYYFITNWTYSDGFWYADFDVDVLASWRTAIGNDAEFILRATQGINHQLIDTAYLGESTKNFVKKNFSTRETSVTGVTGCNWYGIDARDSSRIRRYNVILELAVDSFTIGEQTLSTSGIILVRTTLDNFYEVYRRIINAAGTNYVSQIVVGAHYCPIVPIDYASGSIVKKIKLNIRHGISEILEPTIDLPTDRNCYLISDTTLTVQMQAEVPIRSSEYGRESWMYGPQGRSLFIVGQPFGKVPVDSELFDADIKYVGLKFTLDYLTGMTKVFMSPRVSSYVDIAGKNDIYIQTVNFYASIPVSANGVSDAVDYKLRMGLAAVGLIASGGTALASLVGGSKLAHTAAAKAGEGVGQAAVSGKSSGNSWFARNTAKLAQGVENWGNTTVAPGEDAAIANQLRKQTIGTQAQNAVTQGMNIISADRQSYAQQLNCGDLTMGNQILELYVEETIFAKPSISSMGGPVYDNKIIKNIPGFIKCDSPKFEMQPGMTSTENMAIKAAMVSGFYYE